VIEISMYHKIKAIDRLKDLSLRECAKRLGISVKTVSKYRKMSLKEASGYLGNQRRRSQFDEAREFIKSELAKFEKLSSIKLLRKIKERYPNITAKARALRNYIKPLREAIEQDNYRLYEPVLDMEPGHQVQVDMGESWVERDSSEDKFKIYFVVFVFSYSRYTYVSFRTKPYNTNAFIKAHLEAFNYFGGVARDYVYDQTKLVVIQEKYREVLFNKEFHKFALQYQFQPLICEGYDPESKGKVERFIRYIKSDFLYGEYFKDIEEVRRRSNEWLSTVANIRIHGTTNQKPSEMFKEEEPLLSQRDFILNPDYKRLVDRTGLISFAGNKYSVPSAYQRGEVLVEKQRGLLLVRDKDTGKQIAEHKLVKGKGRIRKNNNHYRDYRKSLEELSCETEDLFSDIEQGAELIEEIAENNPRIVRDQLRGLQSLRKRYSTSVWASSIRLIMDIPHLSTGKTEKVLKRYKKRLRLKQIVDSHNKPDNRLSSSSCLDRESDYYDRRLL